MSMHNNQPIGLVRVLEEANQPQVFLDVNLIAGIPFIKGVHNQAHFEAHQHNNGGVLIQFNGGFVLDPHNDGIVHIDMGGGAFNPPADGHAVAIGAVADEDINAGVRGI